jgi:hypothetical protein
MGSAQRGFICIQAHSVVLAGVSSSIEGGIGYMVSGHSDSLTLEKVLLLLLPRYHVQYVMTRVVTQKLLICPLFPLKVHWERVSMSPIMMPIRIDQLILTHSRNIS